MLTVGRIRFAGNYPAQEYGICGPHAGSGAGRWSESGAAGGAVLAGSAETSIRSQIAPPGTQRLGHEVSGRRRRAQRLTPPSRKVFAANSAESRATRLHLAIRHGARYWWVWDAAAIEDALAPDERACKGRAHDWRFEARSYGEASFDTGG